MIIWTLIFACISAICYRLGGLSKEQAKRDLPFIPSWLINGKIRDIGCTLLTLLWLYLFLPLTFWGYIVSGILMFLALTSYWDESDYEWKNKICKKINWMFPEDNFYLHAFFIALALFPILFKGHILGFLLRCVILSISMGIWCHMLPKSKIERVRIFFSNDYSQELFRGASVVLSLPLLLI